MNRHAAVITSSGERIDVPVSTEFQLCGSCERGAGDYRSVVPTPVETNDERTLSWESYLERWSLRYPCRLEMRTQRQWLNAREFYLRIEFLYPDERDANDGASPVPSADGRLGLWPPSWLPDENTPRWIRANLIYHLTHELDEHLLFDRSRVFDPHVQAHHLCDKCAEQEAAA